MSEIDSITKAYMQNEDIFADVFNFLLYDGEQVIRPEQLRPLDTTSIVLPYGEDSSTVPVQKYRDILKMATAKADDKVAYLLLGIENQTHIHYAMPVRNALYDAIMYANQVSNAGKTHRKEKNIGTTKEEFLSGFHQKDKLLPVITLVVYFGSEPWNAPRSIHEMLEITDKKLLSYMPDYKLNLIVPEEIPDEKMEKFRTEFRALMKYIKYSHDKKKLEQTLKKDEIFKSISHMTADAINKITKSEIKLNAGEESVNMCKAIEDIKNDAIIIGRAEGMERGMEKGRAEGIEKGRAEGMEKGRAEGMERGKTEIVINMLKMQKFTHEDIAAASGLSVETVKSISEKNFPDKSFK